MCQVISVKLKLDEPTRRIQTASSANPESLWTQDRLGPHLLKMSLKRTVTLKPVRQARPDLYLPRQLLTCSIQEDAIVSRSTEAGHIQSRGKGMLQISALLLYSAPCDPATDQPPTASIVPCSAPHCSPATRDAARSMG